MHVQFALAGQEVRPQWAHVWLAAMRATLRAFFQA